MKPAIFLYVAFVYKIGNTLPIETNLSRIVTCVDQIYLDWRWLLLRIAVEVSTINEKIQ